MSIETLAIVLNHSKAKGTDKVVLLGIANHDGDLGAHPGIPTLARYANVAESSAREAVRRLEALGEVRVRPGEGKRINGGVTNGYDVLVECPPECDRSKNHKIRKTPPTGGPVVVDNDTSHRPTGDTSHRPTGGTSHRPTGGEPSLEPSKNHPPTPEPVRIPDSVVRVWEGEGFSKDEQETMWSRLLADPETRAASKRAIQPAYYVHEIAKIRAAAGKARGSMIEQIRRFGDVCEHDMPGGADINPVTDLPFCPICRSAKR